MASQSQSYQFLSEISRITLEIEQLRKLNYEKRLKLELDSIYIEGDLQNHLNRMHFEMRELEKDSADWKEFEIVFNKNLELQEDCYRAIIELKLDFLKDDKLRSRLKSQKSADEYIRELDNNEKESKRIYENKPYVVLYRKLEEELKCAQNKLNVLLNSKNFVKKEEDQRILELVTNADELSKLRTEIEFYKQKFSSLKETVKENNSKINETKKKNEILENDMVYSILPPFEKINYDLSAIDDDGDLLNNVTNIPNDDDDDYKPPKYNVPTIISDVKISTSQTDFIKKNISIKNIKRANEDTETHLQKLFKKPENPFAGIPKTVTFSFENNEPSLKTDKLDKQTMRSGIHDCHLKNVEKIGKSIKKMNSKHQILSHNDDNPNYQQYHREPEQKRGNFSKQPKNLQHQQKQHPQQHYQQHYYQQESERKINQLPKQDQNEQKINHEQFDKAMNYKNWLQLQEVQQECSQALFDDENPDKILKYTDENKFDPYNNERGVSGSSTPNRILSSANTNSSIMINDVENESSEKSYTDHIQQFPFSNPMNKESSFYGDGDFEMIQNISADNSEDTN